MNTKTIGFGLIGFGLILMMINFYQVQVDLTLLLIGGCFLAAYFGSFFGSKRNIGFLIPGCILASLGIWEIVSEVSVLGQYDDIGFFMSVGTAFLAIYLVGKMNGHQVKWSAIVSIAVYAFSAFLYFVSYNTFFKENEDLIFPFILISVGLVILITTSMAKMRKR